MKIGLLLALTSALAYGASDFVGGAGSRRNSPWRLVLIGQLSGAVLMMACGLLAPAAPRAADFMWALLAGVVIVVLLAIQLIRKLLVGLSLEMGPTIT